MTSVDKSWSGDVRRTQDHASTTTGGRERTSERSLDIALSTFADWFDIFLLRGTFEVGYLGDEKSEPLQFFYENVELEQAHHLSRFSTCYTQYPDHQSSGENAVLRKFASSL